eukprot:1518081-Rhodomonas_salina.1
MMYWGMRGVPGSKLDSSKNTQASMVRASDSGSSSSGAAGTKIQCASAWFAASSAPRFRVISASPTLPGRLRCPTTASAFRPIPDTVRPPPSSNPRHTSNPSAPCRRSHGVKRLARSSAVPTSRCHTRALSMEPANKPES